MPAITDSDVAAAIRTKWGATSALTAIVPVARVFRGRIPEGVAAPSVRFRITEQDTERTSGPKAITRFRVEFDCYTQSQPPVANTVRQALDSAFTSTEANPTAGITLTGATVMDIRTAGGGSVRQTYERLDGIDTVITTAVYTLMVSHTVG